MDAQSSHNRRASIAATLSVIAIACSLAALWYAMQQHRRSEEPSMVVDDIAIDSATVSGQWNISLLLSNHGTNVASDVWLDARISMPNDTSATHSAVLLSPRRLGSQASSAQVVATGMMPERVRDAITEGKSNIFLIVDLRYTGRDGDSLHYTTIEHYDKEARRFLVGARFATER